MIVMMTVAWGLVVGAIVAVRSLGSRTTTDVDEATPWRSPESILAERYARGEIDADEYHGRLDDLATHAKR